MLKRAYTLRFVTPAFLGNAEQSGQWRTPPIKALLRQWWRVAYAAEHRGALDVAAMRADEGRLFGVAADREGESRQSQVRIRFGHWNEGKLNNWDGLEQAPVRHQEVERTGYKVGPHAYLGFGPLDGRGGTKFGDKCHAAIQAGEAAPLSLAFPAGVEAVRLERALGLMHRYGTLGGRSRNGWGSFSLTPADAGTPAMGDLLDNRLTATWQDALSIDWPHAIGRDEEGPLIWQTEAIANTDWKAVMRRLAQIKIDMRTQNVFMLKSGKNAAAPELRHWLAYPVTNHNVVSWKDRGKDLRLPNSLRFKVRADGNQLRGVIFHVPCKPPPAFKPDRPTLLQVWQQVHAFLDDRAHKLQRIAA